MCAPVKRLSVIGGSGSAVTYTRSVGAGNSTLSRRNKTLVTHQYIYIISFPLFLSGGDRPFACSGLFVFAEDGDHVFFQLNYKV